MVMTSDMWLGLFEPKKLRNREIFLINEVRKSDRKEKKREQHKDVDKMVI